MVGLSLVILVATAVLVEGSETGISESSHSNETHIPIYDIVHPVRCIYHTGIIPDLEDCRKYILCQDGVGYVIPCPPGQVYVSGNNCTEAKYCDGFEKAAFTASKELKEKDLKVKDLDVCLEPPNVGSCKNNLRRHYFDINTFECREFVYSGCEGNRNNFESKRECQLRCDPRLNPDEEEKPRSDNICVTDGIFPNENDCGSYNQCANGQLYTMKCPVGLHFSAELKRCEYPCTAGCSPLHLFEVCNPEAGQTEVKCLEDGLFPHPDNCSRFIECSKGQPRTKECQIGHHFSETQRRCVDACKAKCDLKLPCVMNDYRCDHEKRFKCPSQRGNFSDPFDCSVYHQCIFNISILRKCISGRYFDNIRKKCVKQGKAECVYVCKEKNGFYEHPHNCEKYIKCRDGKAIVRHCSRGRTYDRVSKQCVSYGLRRCRRNDKDSKE